MKTQKARSKTNVISASRWTAYAAAGTATALAGIHSAEAEIHYSGSINAKLAGQTTQAFEIVPGRVLQFTHHIDYYSSRTKDGGNAFAQGLSFAAFSTSCSYGRIASVSNLAGGNAISERPFILRKGVLASADRENCYGNARGQFINAGVGYIGFKFNLGNGDQYGWARIEMMSYPRNKFRFVDFAYGDPGDRIRAGQKVGGHGPTLESLGGLALGAAGLLAWRRSRRMAR